MLEKKESVFINNQSLKVDKTVRSSIYLRLLKTVNLQEAIEQLEKKEKLVLVPLLILYTKKKG